MRLKEEADERVRAEEERRQQTTTAQHLQQNQPSSRYAPVSSNQPTETTGKKRRNYIEGERNYSSYDAVQKSNDRPHSEVNEGLKSTTSKVAAMVHAVEKIQPAKSSKGLEPESKSDHPISQPVRQEPISWNVRGSESLPHTNFQSLTSIPYEEPQYEAKPKSDDQRYDVADRTSWGPGRQGGAGSTPFRLADSTNTGVRGPDLPGSTVPKVPDSIQPSQFNTPLPYTKPNHARSFSSELLQSQSSALLGPVEQKRLSTSNQNHSSSNPNLVQVPIPNRQRANTVWPPSIDDTRVTISQHSSDANKGKASYDVNRGRIGVQPDNTGSDSKNEQLFNYQGHFRKLSEPEIPKSVRQSSSAFASPNNMEQAGNELFQARAPVQIRDSSTTTDRLQRNSLSAPPSHEDEAASSLSYLLYGGGPVAGNNSSSAPSYNKSAENRPHLGAVDYNYSTNVADPTANNLNHKQGSRDGFDRSPARGLSTNTVPEYRSDIALNAQSAMPTFSGQDNRMPVNSSQKWVPTNDPYNSEGSRDKFIKDIVSSNPLAPFVNNDNYYVYYPPETGDTRINTDSVPIYTDLNPDTAASTNFRYTPDRKTSTVMEDYSKRNIPQPSVDGHYYQQSKLAERNPEVPYYNSASSTSDPRRHSNRNSGTGEQWVLSQDGEFIPLSAQPVDNRISKTAAATGSVFPKVPEYPRVTQPVNSSSSHWLVEEADRKRLAELSGQTTRQNLFRASASPINYGQAENGQPVNRSPGSMNADTNYSVINRLANQNLYANEERRKSSDDRTSHKMSPVHYSQNISPGGATVNSAHSPILGRPGPVSNLAAYSHTRSASNPSADLLYADQNTRARITPPASRQSGLSGAVDSLFSYVGSGASNASSRERIPSATDRSRETGWSGSDNGVNYNGRNNPVSQLSNSHYHGSLHIDGTPQYAPAVRPQHYLPSATDQNTYTGYNPGMFIYDFSHPANK